jgi:ABC-type sugar transport system permease subunit
VTASPVPARRLWLLGAGYGVWFLALAVIYAVHALGCAFAWPTGALRLGLAAALLAGLAVLGWLWRDYVKTAPDPAFGELGSFLRWTVVWTLITAFVTTVLTLGPALLLRTCV